MDIHSEIEIQNSHACVLIQCLGNSYWVNEDSNILYWKFQVGLMASLNIVYFGNEQAIDIMVENQYTFYVNEVHLKAGCPENFQLLDDFMHQLEQKDPNLLVEVQTILNMQ